MDKLLFIDRLVIQVALLVFTCQAGTAQLLAGYEKSVLIASEDFSHNLDNWLVEGKVRARIDNGQLYFESLDPEIDNPKGNIWWIQDFSGPYMIEFDYQSASDHGLTMVFWNAFGVDGKDVFSWTRTGKYQEYVASNLTAYHCTFHRFATGVSNFRKAPGFHLVLSEQDPVEPADRATHKIVIVSAGNRQKLFFDGMLVHDLTDIGAPCISTTSWQHALPCKGTGPVPKHGAFGIRLTQKQQARFDNIKVYKLIKVN